MFKHLLLLLVSLSAFAQELSPEDGAPIGKVVGVSNSTKLATNYLDAFSDGSLACRAADTNGDLITSHLNFGTDQSLDVDVRHSFLPDGAATEVTLGLANGHLASIDTDFDVALSTRASESTLSTLDGKVTNNYGVSTGAVRTASQIGNATGAADFNYGTIGAQSVRTAAQIGNATGAANFGAGATGAQTLRVASNLYDGSANAITSQVNGAQRALDVGINVAGAQIDPRTNTVRTTQATAYADGTQQIPTIGPYGLMATIGQPSILSVWGRVFFVTNNFLATGTTAQFDNVLFRNPNASGQNCIIRRMTFNPPNASEVRFRLYKDPTVTANGTAVTSVGGRNTGQATAVCLATTAPTISARGTIFYTARNANQSSDSYFEPEYALTIEPNHSLLVTTEQSTAGQPGGVSFDWAEQP